MIAHFAGGLHRWTAPHPEWVADPEPGGPLDWPEQVGSVAAEVEGGLVVIDPQLPPEPEAIWPELDALVASAGGRVTVVTTMRFHGRSAPALAERYGAACVKAREAAVAGVEPFDVPEADETLIWLPGPRALVPGDRLVGFGDDDGALHVCPASWLDYLPSGLTVEGLKERLRPLLDLPIELILVSHGEPVMQDGRAALSKALA